MNAGLYTNGVKLQKFKFQDELNDHLVDLELKCSNGVIKAHKIILSSRCSYFRGLIERRPVIQTVTFGDVSTEMMKKVMDLIYGEVVHIPELHIDEFFRVCHILRVDHWVKFSNLNLERPSDISSSMLSSDSAPDISSPTEEVESRRHSGEGESSH